MQPIFVSQRTHNQQKTNPAMTEKLKKLLDQVRNKLRQKNYSYVTEKTYVGWIRRYIWAIALLNS